MKIEPFLRAMHKNECNQTKDFLYPRQKEELAKHRKFLSKYKDGLYIKNPVTYTINHLGYRTRDDIPTTDYILAVGCSHTFGIGLHEEHRFTNLLEDFYKVPVLNVSIPGGSPNSVRDNIIQLLSSDTCLPKLVILQWPSDTRLTFGLQNLGPWARRDLYYARFVALNKDNISLYSKIAKEQTPRLLTKHGIPFISFDMKEREKHFFLDVANDRDHSGIEGNKLVFEHLKEQIDAIL